MPRDTDYVFLFQNRDLLIHELESGFSPYHYREVRDLQRELHYLGTSGERLCYAGAVPDDLGLAEWKSLRSVYLTCTDSLRPAIASAIQVIEWDANHRYCGRCGKPTTHKSEERCRTCPSCGHSSFPRISPAIIVGIIRQGTILLAHNRRHADPMYSIIAGFVEPGENLEKAVLRETTEETSLTVDNVRYFGSQSWPFPDSLMVGFTATYVSGEIRLNEELASADWFAPNSMPKIPPHGTISRRIIDWFVAETGDVSPR